MQAEQQSERERFDAWKLLDNPRYQPTDDSMQDRRDWKLWQAALSHPSTPQGWQSIETAPTNVQVVALYKGKIPVIAHKNAPNDSPSGWCHLNAGGPAFDAPHRGLTHWMPLPPPPEQGSKNADQA